jgi:hypothetical protein
MHTKSVTRKKKCHNNIQSKKSVTISSILHTYTTFRLMNYADYLLV